MQLHTRHGEQNRRVSGGGLAAETCLLEDARAGLRALRWRPPVHQQPLSDLAQR